MRYPFIKQAGLKDCAATSLLMIIKYYGGYVNIDDLNEMLHTTRNGTTAYDLVEVSKKLGFVSKGVRAPLQELNNENVVCPFIVHTLIEGKYKHFMVVYKIDFKNKQLLIADPQTKLRKYTFSEFEKIYSDIAIMLYPYKPIIKNNEVNIKSVFKNIFAKYKKEFIQIFIISSFYIICSIITSFYFKILFDNLYSSKKYLLIIFLAFLIINFIRLLSNYLRSELLIFINKKIDVELNMDTYEKVINLPYHYYKNRTTGEVMSKIIDLDKIRDALNKIIIVLFVDIPLTLISSVVLFIISKKLFLISIIFMLFYILIILVFKPVIKDKTDSSYQNKTEVISLMQESINGFETVKGLNLENKMIKKYENKYIKYLKEVIAMNKIMNLETFLKEIVNIYSEVILIYVGIIYIKNSELTIGTLLAFNSMQSFFFSPIRSMIDLDFSLIEAKRVVKKIYEMFSKKNTKIYKKVLRGNININNLSYSYNDNKILDNISLNIKKGDKIVILGKSGSGKSTFLKLLMNYLEVKRNTIIYDNTDINDIDNLKSNISYISQNEVLFTDTIYNNISICSNNDIENIVKDCFVEEIVANNSLGLNMVLEENGFNISGGQKQRIILARALAKDSNIILIDEGLNEVDINLERKILTRVFDRYKDKTFIVVSHRKENIDLFNRKIILEKGKIIENE